MLPITSSDDTASERTGREWFQRFKCGGFNFKDRHSGGEEKFFKDAELETFLSENLHRNQEPLVRSLEGTQQATSKRLKAMGMIQKEGTWVRYRLKPRGDERRLCICEQILQRQNASVF